MQNSNQKSDCLVSRSYTLPSLLVIILNKEVLGTLQFAIHSFYCNVLTLDNNGCLLLASYGVEFNSRMPGCEYTKPIIHNTYHVKHFVHMKI